MLNETYIGNFSDLVGPCRKSGVEWLFNCPYCHSIFGKKEDKNFKFSFNSLKRKGHCWRCGSVVLDQSVFSKDQLIDLFLNQDQEKELNDTINKYNHQEFDVSFWTKSVLDNPESRKYMIENRRIYPEILEEYNVRVCEDPKLGVLFLDDFKRDKLTKFFQIRNINSKIRHTFIKDIVKPISWLSRIKTHEVVLAEGFTSGLSIYQHSKKECSPIIATGKSVTKFQKHLIYLNSKKIKSLTICFDGGFVNDALKAARSLYNVGVPIYIMNLEKDKDPNDVTRDEFMRAFENRVLYNTLKENFIKNYLLNYE
jgi:hypothetical protein